MSNRTIMEFNHDMTHEIDRDRDAFVDALTHYLRSGSRDAADDLNRFGITVGEMAHHSRKRKAVVDGREHHFG